MEEKMVFRKRDGSVVANVEKYVKDWVKTNKFGTVTIGCDSQVHGRKIKYSTVIIMHYVDATGVGHGAHVLSCEVWIKRMNGKNQIEEMPTKLWREAEFVLAAAEMVDGHDESFKKNITIHLDFNSEEKAGSNFLFASGMGFITGMGYKAVGKPDAWAASHTADSLCR
jgi:predicted RNase H-related nuclease YkuK (DUF458 family)